MCESLEVKERLVLWIWCWGLGGLSDDAKNIWWAKWLVSPPLSLGLVFVILFGLLLFWTPIIDWSQGANSKFLDSNTRSFTFLCSTLYSLFLSEIRLELDGFGSFTRMRFYYWCSLSFMYHSWVLSEVFRMKSFWGLRWWAESAAAAPMILNC